MSGARRVSLDLFAVAASPDRVAWEFFRPGVRIHRLYDAGPDGGSAALLRYEPGAGVPAHDHPGYEHILVLAGAQEDDRGRYGVGQLVVNEPGSGHSVHCPEGCIVLVIWQKKVIFRP